MFLRNKSLLISTEQDRRIVQSGMSIVPTLSGFCFCSFLTFHFDFRKWLFTPKHFVSFITGTRKGFWWDGRSSEGEQTGLLSVSEWLRLWALWAFREGSKEQYKYTQSTSVFRHKRCQRKWKFILKSSARESVGILFSYYTFTLKIWKEFFFSVFLRDNNPQYIIKTNFYLNFTRKKSVKESISHNFLLQAERRRSQRMGRPYS